MGIILNTNIRCVSSVAKKENAPQKRKQMAKKKKKSSALIAIEKFNAPLVKAMRDMPKMGSSDGSRLESWAFNHGGMGWGRH